MCVYMYVLFKYTIANFKIHTSSVDIGTTNENIDVFYTIR